MEAMRSNESVSKIRQIWFSISAFYTRVCSYILEHVTVHLSLYLSIQTDTQVCSFQRQTIVTWTFKDNFYTRVCKYILEYGTICEKIFKFKTSILEYSFLYLSIQNRCKVENLCKSPILEYAKPILEYTTVVKVR